MTDERFYLMSVPAHGRRTVARLPRVVSVPDPAGASWRHTWRPWAIVALVLVAVLAMGIDRLRASGDIVETMPQGDDQAPATIEAAGHTFTLATATPAPTAASVAVAAPSRLWPGFAPTVKRWEPLLVKWADQYGIDPNLAAIIMQVESCGDPSAVSPAGARGLFQVMPYHFAAGEDALDPDTNARRGLAYFADRLQQTGGDVGRAFAGYNGGHGAAASSWDAWPAETQRYYLWTTGILAELQAGKLQSTTLERWYAAGGASLCNQAAAVAVQ